jgi:hypothetical protein
VVGVQPSSLALALPPRSPTVEAGAHGGNQPPTVPQAPAPPAGSAASAAGSSGTALFALLAAAAVLALLLSTPLKVAVPRWRPQAFVAVLERPG